MRSSSGSVAVMKAVREAGLTPEETFSLSYTHRHTHTRVHTQQAKQDQQEPD